MTHKFDLRQALKSNGEKFKESKTTGKYHRFRHITNNNGVNLVAENIREVLITANDGNGNNTSYFAWQTYGFTYFKLDEKFNIIKKEYLPYPQPSNKKHFNSSNRNADQSVLAQGDNHTSNYRIKNSFLNENTAKILFINTSSHYVQLEIMKKQIPG